MKYVKSLSDAVFKVEKIVGIILLTVMLGSIAAGVFFRYFLKSPLSWSDELAIFMLVWVTFIGGSMSIKRQQAAAVSLLLDRLNRHLRNGILALGNAINTVFCFYIAYLAFNWITAPSVSMQISPSLGITMFYQYLSIPIGFFCMGIHFFYYFGNSLMKMRETDRKRM